MSSIAEFVGDAIVYAYQVVVLEAGSVLLHGFFERPRNHHLRREVLLMPLGTDGGSVDFVLSAGILMPRDGGAHRDVHPEESTVASRGSPYNRSPIAQENHTAGEVD